MLDPKPTPAQYVEEIAEREDFKEFQRIAERLHAKNDDWADLIERIAFSSFLGEFASEESDKMIEMMEDFIEQEMCK